MLDDEAAITPRVADTGVILWSCARSLVVRLHNASMALRNPRNIDRAAHKRALELAKEFRQYEGWLRRCRDNPEQAAAEIPLFLSRFASLVFEAERLLSTILHGGPW